MSKSQMDEECYAKEVEEKINANDVKPTVESEKPTVKCQSPEHEDDDLIREGNRVFSVIVKRDGEWHVESLTCWQCSVRNVLDKSGNEDTIAVVESTLRVDQEYDELYFENPEVWELMLAN